MRKTTPETCPPRYLTPDPGHPSRIAAYETLAAELGIDLLWHQRLLLHRLSQYDPQTGLPTYDRATVTLPRQQGKSVTTLLLVLERLLLRAQPCLFAAQDIGAVVSFWRGFPYQLLTQSGFGEKFGVEMVTRHAYLILRTRDTRIEMKTIAAQSRASGHGSTVGLVVLDEAWAMNEVLEDNVRPAIQAVPDSQLIRISTAGDASSFYFKEHCDQGRADVGRGRTAGRFYAEWSAQEEANIDDEETWWSCMPALGHTTSLDKMRGIREDSSDYAWERSNLNRWIATTADPPIHPDAWSSVEVERSVRPEGQVILGVHAPPHANYWVIVACDAHGRVELASWRNDLATLVEQVHSMLDRFDDIAEIVIDPSSPVGAYADALAGICARYGRAFRGLSARDVDHACMTMADECAHRRLRIARHDLLRSANAHSRKKWKGSTWRIEPTGDTDVAALYALAFAVLGARQFGDRQPAKRRSRVIDTSGWSPDAAKLSDRRQRLLAGQVVDG